MKLLIIKASLAGADILLLDEPTNDDCTHTMHMRGTISYKALLNCLCYYACIVYFSLGVLHQVFCCQSLITMSPISAVVVSLFVYTCLVGQI